MNTLINNNQINQKGIRGKLSTMLVAILALFYLGSCNSDDVGDNYYTFTGLTMGEFIDNPSKHEDFPNRFEKDDFSEFRRMLDTSNVMGLLKAYGKYTCFIPTNEAIQQFYEDKGYSGLSDISIDSIQNIVYNHIIKDYELISDNFYNGFLPNLTMSGRYLKVAFEPSSTGVIYNINDSSAIVVEDVENHNGIAHVIDHVISPTDNTIVEAIGSDEKFTLFFKALVATGLNNELMKTEDADYVVPQNLYDDKNGVVQGHLILTRVPTTKKYGYTVLCESDETFRKYGINNIDDMAEYAKTVYDPLYPNDASITDVKNRKNSLNRFIAYHLINKKIPTKNFIETWDNTGKDYETSGQTHSVKTVDMFEYLAPMCPNTLIEVRTIRTTGEYNVFNMTDDGEAVRLTDYYDNDATNGVYHEIDGILHYSLDMINVLTTKRIRMDGASFFPELMNNNMRIGASKISNPSIEWDFPDGYIEGVKVAETTIFGYISCDDRFLDYQGDEIFLQSGMYEFTMTTLPVPAGTYEVRFAYQPTDFRGAAQLYWDGLPCGIPLNLSLTANNPKIGYVRPGLDASDPYGYENDKMMRNRGYMKGGAGYKVIQPDWYSGTGRMSPNALRRILGIYTFDKDTTHEFSVKASRRGQFMFDFIEFVPIEVLETEDIY